MAKLDAKLRRTAADLKNAGKGRRAASRAGDSLGSESAQRSGGPVNVLELATAEDIEVVQVASLAESGRIEWTSAGLRIALREEDGPQRQRFTLAHELGHFYIFGIERVGARAYLPEEERRCDKFASALLMPEERFRSLLRHHRNLSRLSAVRELASQFDVSLHAAVARFHELGLTGADSILLVCSADAKGDFKVQSAAYDKSAYAPLGQLSVKDLGIEDVLLPESVVRVRLPTKQGRPPHGSYRLAQAAVTCLPMSGDHRQVLLEVEMGPSAQQRRLPPRPAEVQRELFEVG